MEELASPTTRFARLTHEQWENTVRDLLRFPDRPGLAGDFAPDPDVGRFDNNMARLDVPAGLWADYQRAAESVAEQVVASAEALTRIWPSGAPTEPEAEARAFVTELGMRAFRRPLTETEIARYVVLYGQGSELYPALAAREAGVRIVVEALLQSPYFLYRVEKSAEVVDGVIPIDPFELASRMSYAVWNTMPDEALFEAAATGSLGDPETLSAQAKRLLDDPRANDTIAMFHAQLFELDDYTKIAKSDTLFPEFDRALADAMREESALFVASIAEDEGGSIRDFLTSSRTFVNGDLAALYALPGDFGEDFVEVELDGAIRAGFLTRVGFLAKNATLTDSDPIHRGVFVNNHLLCRDLSAVPNLPENLMPVGNTTRERVNSITGPGTCGAGCHATIINPIGFGLEAFDALGQHRTHENDYPVDTSSTYRAEGGTTIEFDGAVELSRQLAELDVFHRCYADQLLEHTYQRAAHDNDTPLLYRLTQRSLEGAITVKDILAELIVSPAFRARSTTELEVTQ